MNVFCGIVRDKLIGPHSFFQRLSADIYTEFLQNGLPALLENVSLQTTISVTG
jgi:hypothetical protein